MLRYTERSTSVWEKGEHSGSSWNQEPCQKTRLLSLLRPLCTLFPFSVTNSDVRKSHLPQLLTLLVGLQQLVFLSWRNDTPVCRFFPTNHHSWKGRKWLSSHQQLWNAIRFHLWGIFFFFCLGRTAWHVGSYFPDQAWNPCPLQWKCKVLTAGLPGNSAFEAFLD